MSPASMQSILEEIIMAIYIYIMIYYDDNCNYKSFCLSFSNNIRQIVELWLNCEW